MDYEKIGEQIKAKYPEFEQYSSSDLGMKFVADKMKKENPAAYNMLKISKNMGNFSTGFLKSAADHALSASEFIQKGLSKVTEKITGTKVDTERPEALKKMTTPVGGAQKAGAVTESVLEWLIPGSQLKAAKTAIAGTKAIKGLSAGGKISQFAAKTLPSSMVEGAFLGGLSTLEEGNNATLGKTAGMTTLGAAIPVVGGVIGKVYRAVAPEAKSLLVKAVRPVGKNANQFIQNADEVMQEIYKVNPEVKDLYGFRDTARKIAQDNWAKVEANLSAAEKQALKIKNSVITDSIDQAVKENKVFQKAMFEDPEGTKAKVELFKKMYSKELSPTLAEDILEGINGELKSAYNTGNFTTLDKAMYESIARGLRTELERVSTEGVGEGVSKYKQLWNKMNQAARYADSRIPAIERSAESGLAQQVITPWSVGEIIYGLETRQPALIAKAAGQMTVGAMMKHFEGANKQIARAFSLLGKKAAGQAQPGLGRTFAERVGL